MSAASRASVSAPPQVIVRVPAKVNVHLGVGSVGPDGYHELATVLQAVSLYDEVVATPAARVTVAVTGESADLVPTGPANLAHRAAALLARRAGVSVGVHLELRKQIPVAGGMGGGSADAAGALLACDALWGTQLGRAQLLELAADLGSDVPFCLLGGTAVGTGRGETLTPALVRGRFHWVLALSESGLSTPAVYVECDRLRSSAGRSGGREVRPLAVPDRLMHALRVADAVALGAVLHNDLQSAACSLMPALRQVLAVGQAAGALGAVVSGSGPTVAFLVADEETGADIATALRGAGACRDVRHVVGPVPGARIVG